VPGAVSGALVMSLGGLRKAGPAPRRLCQAKFPAQINTAAAARIEMRMMGFFIYTARFGSPMYQGRLLGPPELRLMVRRTHPTVNEFLAYILNFQSP